MKALPSSSNNDRVHFHPTHGLPSKTNEILLKMDGKWLMSFQNGPFSADFPYFPGGYIINTVPDTNMTPKLCQEAIWKEEILKSSNKKTSLATPSSFHFQAD